MLGVAQGRKLPRFARRSFLQNAAMRRFSQPAKRQAEKVAYFVDTYANHFDTQLAEAMVAVLRHNGVGVYVPTDQQEAAMPMISQGALEPARLIAQRNVALLAEAVRQGYKVIATEPSAVLALTHEYPLILDEDEDAVLVAQNTFDACHYLWQLHQGGKLKLGFQPQRISVGYHVPCHLRALEVGAPAENLLRLVPGLRVHRVEQGCSGIAGLYGLKRENYRASLRAGVRLINAIRTGPFQVGMTECSTCKIQMEQGTTKPTIHPVKLLALAYGLMPELAALVRTPGQAAGGDVKVCVKLFAAARDAAGAGEVTVDVGDDATVGDVERAMVAKLPSLAVIVSHARWAVDAAFVSKGCQAAKGCRGRVDSAGERRLTPIAWQCMVELAMYG